jgi:DNA-directed RNA polymerase subunit RPC12/RpoP
VERTITYIVIGVVIISAVAIPIHLALWKNNHYVCPKCGREFKPKKFLQSMFSMNGADIRRMKCAYCGEKNWTKIIKDKQKR